MCHSRVGSSFRDPRRAVRCCHLLWVWLSLRKAGPAILVPLTSPSPSASTPAKLTVNILDVNDNTPQFKPFGITYYTERVLEGATPGTTLIAVAAVDPDKGLNGLITYTLLDLVPPGYVQLEDSSAGR